MMNTIKSQFGHPRGLLGQVVGVVMAYENRKRIAWAVQQLQPQPGDDVLEIGFGPGVGISLLAEKATRVAGVDISEVMLRQATRRNAKSIRDGRVILRQGAAESIPFENQQFDKVLVINSLHIWPDIAAGLSECQRVLKPGGQLAVVEQPPEKISDANVMRGRGMDIMRSLNEAGFQSVTQRLQSFPNGWATFVEGVKSG